MMIKTLPARMVKDVKPYPFDVYPQFQVPEEAFRKYLYSADWFGDMEDDKHSVVMDFDGFVKYYNEHVPQWIAEQGEEGEEFFKDYSAYDYLRDHIDRTVWAVRIDMTVREYAESVGVAVVGNLRRIPEHDPKNCLGKTVGVFYIDAAGNEFTKYTDGSYPLNPFVIVTADGAVT